MTDKLNADSINERIKVLDNDIKKVQEQMVSLDRQKQEFMMFWPVLGAEELFKLSKSPFSSLRTLEELAEAGGVTFSTLSLGLTKSKEELVDDLKFQQESGVDETMSNEPTVAKEKDTKESEMFMEMCLSYLKSENLSVKEIENFFPDNKDNFMRLKDEIPSEYNNLITMFKTKKKELQKGDK